MPKLLPKDKNIPKDKNSLQKSTIPCILYKSIPFAALILVMFPISARDPFLLREPEKHTISPILKLKKNEHT